SLAGRDLTIKAGAGRRPVLRPARAAGPVGEAALLRFRGGQVVLEGLEFVLDPGERDDPLAAVFAEGVDLTIRRCLFRRPASAGGRARLAAVALRAEAGPGRDHPAPARVVASHFDGGQVALLARGPASLTINDATFGPAEPA